MLDLKVKQRGLGAIQIVLVLVVLGVIASAGWLTYSHYQKADYTAVTTPSKTSAIKTLVKTQQPAPVANQNVVKIPELGIQITVPDDIKDLKYQVSTVTLRNGQQATLAMFSTATLIGIDAGCSTSFGPLGSLERANGQYPSNDQLAGFKYGMLVKQFPTFYISAGFPQAACSTHNSANGAAIKFKSEFAAAESTIQQLN